MKKALIITNLSGFLLKFETENVRLLQEAGFEVHYASNVHDEEYPYAPEQLKSLGVIFHHIDIARSPCMLRMNLDALRQLRALLRQEQFRLIHCHTPVGAALGRLAPVFCGVRPGPVVLYTAHGFHFYRGAPLFNRIVYRAAERLLAHLTDGIVVINQEDYLAARTFHLRRQGCVWKVPGTGLNREKFCPAGEEGRRKAREKLGIPQDTFLLLSVGELNENKNHEVVIRAVKELKRRLPDRNLLCCICGDGYYRDRMQVFIDRLHLHGQVVLCGYRQDIAGWYAAADLTVFPSRREGLGIAALESLAMGVPVAAADNRGTREYMRNGSNGFVCRWNDVKGFAACIRRYQDMPEQERQKMKDCCVRTAEPFDRVYTNQVMREIYREMEERFEERRLFYQQNIPNDDEFHIKKLSVPAKVRYNKGQ